ncbi:MAG: 50S ribosomal protein L25 [Parcubacteria group bacterium CG08_land_8_20_14_0_20_43_9]|nr:MAG: 50S ribosomal protein L25 [Parcubacteria group bacterium CG08_land_8_20_14_0_20_43_9]
MVSKNAIPLSAEVRETKGSKAEDLRKQGFLPAVAYGPKIEGTPLILNSKEFDKVFAEAGEHALIDLKIKGRKESAPVLVHDIQKDGVSGRIIHVDFYAPDLEKKVEMAVELVLEGESPAVKKLGGTIIKTLSELEIKALPTNIPDEIKVNIESLDAIGKEIFVRDLVVPEGVEILKDPDEVLVLVAAPTKVEEELEKPIEEKIEEIEGMVKKGEEGAEEAGEAEEGKGGAEKKEGPEKKEEKKEKEKD